MTHDTVASHFDCECPNNYIHLKSREEQCSVCGTHHTEQPDSCLNEMTYTQKLEYAVWLLAKEHKTLYEEFDPDGELAVHGQVQEIVQEILDGNDQ